MVGEMVVLCLGRNAHAFMNYIECVISGLQLKHKETSSETGTRTTPTTNCTWYPDQQVAVDIVSPESKHN